jgi:hypothetical protein
MQHKVYIAYSQGDSNFVTAMFYVEVDIDIYGWHMVARDHQVNTSFFMIENFYDDCTPNLYRSLANDVYELWVPDYPPANATIRCPIPDAVMHELERIQSHFIQEWLFFDGDPDIGSEIAAYRSCGLPVQAANIKYRKLNKFDKEAEIWTHKTPGADFNIPVFIERHGRFNDILLDS